MKGKGTSDSGAIVVQLTDGLGNQLFQYAFAKALEQVAGGGVQLDVSWFPEFGGQLRKATPRHYGMEMYPLSLSVVPVGYAQQVIYGKGLLGRIRKALHVRRSFLRERDRDFCLANLKSVPAPSVLRGFFQKAEYAESVREQLLADLALPEEQLNEANRQMIQKIKAAGEKAVMLHIRRGDYLKSSVAAVFGCCDAEYYRRAEALVEEKAGDDIHLFVFTDDPEWVRENYKTRHQMTLVDINSAADGAHLDINLMRHCAHAITANSTFSWWGAWLIANPGKCVVSPASWYADGRKTPGLLPESWHTV